MRLSCTRDATAMRQYLVFFFFFNATATTEIYTLSLHDALPISSGGNTPRQAQLLDDLGAEVLCCTPSYALRSEEHTSELQSLRHLVCRLLLEKKNSPK